MAQNEFIMTIDSDSEELPLPSAAGKSKAAEGEDAVLNADFTFDLGGELGDIFTQDEINNITVNSTGAVRASLSVLHGLY
jgi:hypothetical protein